MKVRVILPMVLVLLVSLAACNLPTSEAGPSQTENSAGEYVPVVSVSITTDCRSGPGVVYDSIGVVDPGQEVEVVARNPEGDYWLVRDPASPATLCWLEGTNATISSIPVSLPVYTPPPTPTLVGGGPAPGSGCPSPVPSGPTPVSCPTYVPGYPQGSGCPSPVPSGPTPVSCSTTVYEPPPPNQGPTPPPGGPTTVPGGCPSPVPSGPTPVSCP